MEAPRLDQLALRVVAWHNRHPLARRVAPGQVHSIGEVQLPFATSAAAALTLTQAARTTPAGEPAPSGDGTAPAAPTEPADTAAEGPTLAQALSRRAAALATPAPPEVAELLADDVSAAPQLPEAQAADTAEAPAAGDDAQSLPTGADAADAGDADAVFDTPADAQPSPDGEPLAEPVTEAAADASADPTPDPTPDPFADTIVTPPADPAGDVAEVPTADALDVAGDAESTPASAAPADAAGGGLDDALDAALADAEAQAKADAAARAEALSGLDLALADAEAQVLQAAADGAGDGAAGTDAEPQGSDPQASAWPAGTAPLQALKPLRTLFSEKFIWPLSPARVARWARRHGQLAPIAPPDWPTRVVETDVQRLSQARQAGQQQTLMVHVLTAGIGVGDRRLRLLIGADGRVLGPRAYSPWRVALASMLALALAVTGAGAALWRRQAVALDAVPAAATAASAPASAASDSAAHAADAASAASAPAEAASAPAEAASDAAALAGGHGSPVGAAAPADGHEPPAPATAATPQVAQTEAGGHGPAATETAEPTADGASAAARATTASLPVPRFAPPGLVRTQRASEPLVRIRPQLSDEQKLAARAAVAQANGQPPPKPPQVFAVVTAPAPQRGSSEAMLPLMQSAQAQLLPPLPDHVEVLPVGRQWRAAWWPFASLADAERARVILASRGLKAEVVEF